MKKLLSLFLCLLSFNVAQAAVAWEYASLKDSSGSMRAFLSWSSPKSSFLEADNAKRLAIELKTKGELPQSAIVEDFDQLLQALGNEGWELVQVENNDRPQTGLRSKTYHFKRQKG